MGRKQESTALALVGSSDSEQQQESPSDEHPQEQPEGRPTWPLAPTLAPWASKGSAEPMLDQINKRASNAVRRFKRVRS
jgi:hypothetical protein